MLKMLITAMCVLLVGCGGGDPESPADVGPVDCKGRPEVCL